MLWVRLTNGHVSFVRQAQPAHRAHHGNFPGNGPGPKPGNWGKLGNGPGGPNGAPRGPGGTRMGPHPRFAPFQTGSTPPPPLTTPIRPNPIFRKTEKVPPPDSVEKPTFQKLSVRGSTHPWGVPRSIRTDTESSIAYGCQKCLPKPIPICRKSHFSVPTFPSQAQPAPGRSPSQKFPWWAGYAYSA